MPSELIARIRMPFNAAPNNRRVEPNEGRSAELMRAGQEWRLPREIPAALGRLTGSQPRAFGMHSELWLRVLIRGADRRCQSAKFDPCWALTIGSEPGFLGESQAIKLVIGNIV